MKTALHSVGWRLSGACRAADPELFFPEGAGRRAVEQERAAKRLCARCLVRQACLTWALTAPEGDGIWGGTTASERRLLRAGALARELAELSEPLAARA